MGNLVSAFVELTIAEALLLETQRDGVGMGRGVGFDVLVDQGGVGVSAGGCDSRWCSR